MEKKEKECRAFHKHKSIVMFVIGILITLNALYGWFSWGVFVGGIIALLGLIGIVHSKFK